MKPLKKSVSITLDSDVIEQIKYLADDSFRPFSQYVNLVLKGHIKAVERRKAQEQTKIED